MSLQIRREEVAGTVTLHLVGTFDGSTAHQLNGLLEGMEARELVVDFSQVRRFVDAAVAVASQGMTRHQVKLNGLDRHQERVFRYFGVDQAPPGPRAEGRAEEARTP